MGKELSLLVKGIRLSSKIIGVIILIVFLSLGYTIYAEFEYFAKNPEIFQPSISDRGFEVKLPNKGLYPIEFQVKVEGYINELKFLSGDTERILIKPNEEKDVKFEIKQEFEETLSKELLQTLLVKGGEIRTDFLVFVSLKPFITIKIPMEQAEKIEPMLKGLGVRVKEIREYNSTHLVISLEVSADNKLPFLVAGNLDVELVKSPNLGEGNFGEGNTNIVVNPLSKSISEVQLIVLKDAVGYGEHVFQFTFSMLDFKHTWKEVIKIYG